MQRSAPNAPTDLAPTDLAPTDLASVFVAPTAATCQCAGAIAAAGHADDLHDGLDIARKTLDSGAAAERLEALVAFSHDG